MLAINGFTLLLQIKIPTKKEKLKNSLTLKNSKMWQQTVYLNFK